MTGRQSVTLKSSIFKSGFQPHLFCRPRLRSLALGWFVAATCTLHAQQTATAQEATTGTIRGTVVYEPDPQRPWRLGRYYIHNAKTARGSVWPQHVAGRCVPPRFALSLRTQWPADRASQRFALSYDGLPVRRSARWTRYPPYSRKDLHLSKSIFLTSHSDIFQQVYVKHRFTFLSIAH